MNKNNNLNKIERKKKSKKGKKYEHIYDFKWGTYKKNRKVRRRKLENKIYAQLNADKSYGLFEIS